MERIELRRAALERLVRCEELEVVRAEQAEFEWDSEELVELTAVHVCTSLRRYLTGEFTAVDLEGWANFLECRDDLYIPQGSVIEAVFDLANPLVRGDLDRERATVLLDGLAEGA